MPDWVHLLPTTGGEVATFDGRGPYRIGAIDQIIAASMANPRGMPIDENHSTDLAAPQGGASPARGWIVELASRTDGLWGRVEWTESGRALLSDRAYRGLSPVLMIDAASGLVSSVARASLTNKPNLRGLEPILNQENMMSFMTDLAARLGLAAGASEADILAAIPSRDATATLQSAMAEIGTELGVDAANTAAVIAAVKGKKAEGAAMAALQAENSGFRARVAELEGAAARRASEAVIDRHMADRRAGLNADTRETYVTLHMSQPRVAETLIAAMPILGPTGATAQPPVGAGEITVLNAEQSSVARLLGLSPETYLAQIKADQKKKEAI